MFLHVPLSKELTKPCKIILYTFSVSHALSGNVIMYILIRFSLFIANYSRHGICL